MSHVTHLNESNYYVIYTDAALDGRGGNASAGGSWGGMGWLRSVGSIKLLVSFAEYCLFCRALLQKRPIILSILLTKATP